MKSTSYYVKTSILSVMLLVESFVLTSMTLNFIKALNFVTPPLEIFLQIGLLMLLLIYTYSLTLGGWNKWEQYLVIPVPVALGIFFVLIQLDLTYALIISVVVALLLMFDVYQTSRLIGLLVKFDPNFILKLSTKGMLFVFALLAAGMLYLATNYSTTKLDIVTPIKNQINTLIGTQTQLLLKTNFGIADLTQLDALGLNPQKIISSKVDEFVKNYQHFVTPIVMLIIFSIYQFIGSIASFIFSLTIGPLFGIAKKAGFFKVELTEITKETLHF